MVAGIIATLIRGESFGSAARLGGGSRDRGRDDSPTELCRREDAESIMDAVGVT